MEFVDSELSWAKNYPAGRLFSLSEKNYPAGRLLLVAKYRREEWPRRRGDAEIWDRILGRKFLHSSHLSQYIIV
jgi:hypothetical protein